MRRRAGCIQIRGVPTPLHSVLQSQGRRYPQPKIQTLKKRYLKLTHNWESNSPLRSTSPNERLVLRHSLSGEMFQVGSRDHRVHDGIYSKTQMPGRDQRRIYLWQVDSAGGRFGVHVALEMTSITCMPPAHSVDLGKLAAG